MDIGDKAIPSNIRYGTRIVERGGVSVISSDDTATEAWVGGVDGTVRDGGGQRRRARLTLESGDVIARCGGGPAQERWCKHTIALAIFLKQ